MRSLQLPRLGSPISAASGLVSTIEAELPPIGLSALLKATRTTATYRLGGRSGAIAFTVSYLGLLHGDGLVRRYTGRLTANRADRAIAGIELAIEPGDISLSWRNALPGLRPERPAVPMRFRSTAVDAVREGRWRLRGLMEVGATPDLQTLDVVLLDCGVEAITGTEIASFEVRGKLAPSLFGLADDGAPFGLALRLRVEFDSRA
jgi:polyisoprenoid-binding protein YceI